MKRTVDQQYASAPSVQQKQMVRRHALSRVYEPLMALDRTPADHGIAPMHERCTVGGPYKRNNLKVAVVSGLKTTDISIEDNYLTFLKSCNIHNHTCPRP